MKIPNQIFLTDLFRHHVRCEQGIDHGLGCQLWMHPPVHRILGWASRPSSFSNTRHVWRLNQICGISKEEVFVKGISFETDTQTLLLLPSLMDSHLLNSSGEKIGIVADFVFNLDTGKILYYLISRSDPRLPGTSRWKLDIDKILDQKPGRIEVDLQVLDELPLLRSSFKQDFLRKARGLKDQFDEMSTIASDRLEGWLEEPPWNEQETYASKSQSSQETDPLFDWDDNISNPPVDYPYDRHQSQKSFNIEESRDDPWV